MIIQMNEKKIRDLAGEVTFWRGKDYYFDKRVGNWSFKDGVLSAQVRGSRKSPYQIKVYLNRKEVHSECTCSVEWGNLCKHAVAALLTFALQDQTTRLTGTVKVNVAPAKKSSLLLSDENHVWENPILRFIMPSRSLSGVTSKGIKIQVQILCNHKIIPVANLSSIADPLHHSFESDPSLPPFNVFNTAQRHCLKMAFSFLGDAYEKDMKIEPYELALLMKEAEGEGIEFYEGKSNRLNVRRDKVVLMSVAIAAHSKGVKASLILRDPDNPDAMIQGGILEGRPSWLVDSQGGRIFPFPIDFDIRLLSDPFHYNDEVIISTSKAPHLLYTVLPNLQNQCAIIDQDHLLKQTGIDQAPPKFQIYLDYKSKILSLDVKALYGSRILELKEMINASEFISVGEKAEARWIKRDLKAERHLIRFLTESCLVEWDEGRLVIEDFDDIMEFLGSKISLLEGKCEVLQAPDFKEKLNFKSVIRPRLNFQGEGIDWFHFDVNYVAQGIDQKFSFEEIQRQINAGKSYLKLKSGEVVSIAKDEFKEAQRILEEINDGKEKLPMFHAPSMLEETSRRGLQTSFDPSFKKWYDRLKEFKAIAKAELPKDFKGVLRDYQQKGLDWMEFLNSFRFGGILADEMGLGKTVQVLALLKKQKQEGKKIPSLVICPTTLVWNWQAEIEKFTPDLKIVVPHGLDRRLQIEDVKDCDVAITSYSLLRRDAVYYESIEFNYIILDEAQNIKNRHTLNARMSKKLKSHHRLVLTGTPLENSLADLWSIFDFLMPGFLGSYDRFRKLYEGTSIDEEDKPLERLAQKIKPFLLRRLKKEVIKELPEKIEQVSLCELEPTQARCYGEMLQLVRKQVLDAYKSKGLDQSRMMILTVLLRLRQICCHPQLANIDLGHPLSVSAKLNLLKEIVQEALSGGHKVLVFSQFVEMLSIIKDYLNKENIPFEYMDGSTKDRLGAVERFNGYPETKIFLLSLKTGGVGLNLTSADTVILFEPWWNPSVEDQAIDRAHRIGQQKVVTAYKLICKGTIEEKILELQKRKKNIIDSLVVSEEGIAKKLGWDDIKFLLDIEEK